MTSINKGAYVSREDIMKLQTYKLAEGCDEIFVSRDAVLELIDFADDPDTNVGKLSNVESGEKECIKN